METLEDIWESVAKLKYPTLNESQLFDLRLKAAVEWFVDEDTELCKIYDQFVMLKQLLDIKSD